ncbi:hypothetical protein HEK616_43540 [Streptomyces nigrescens]|uniref:Uncharacterized protein n=2 Tax=Streptomyces TaxID=1883 RepID=A0ABM7ZWY1_STRNI|nr:hypothetical protein [Streptomyces nigrescens]MEE4420254.1 hypothetical protein [Streptomyces sp. DSM 41528]BDM70867.1 hypothetical protein HEK616_43540 [Streptomyces nigrescens]
MAVKYIDVTASSNLFAPAVRAFGDIAIIGRGGFGTAESPPRDFTSPSAAADAYPAGSTTLAADAAPGATGVTVPVNVPAATTVRIGTGTGSEIRKVTNSAAAGADFTLTLDPALEGTHAAGDKVRQESPNDLVRAIGAAFNQSPPPTRVWGVQVDFAGPDWDAALVRTGVLDVQIVVLANTPLNQANAETVGKLADHVTTIDGDGKERIGVAMLDGSLSADDAVALNTGSVRRERMVLVAHRSPDDVAAATAGVIAGYRPHISLLLKPISIAMTQTFSESEIDKYDTHLINWITSPVLLPGQALYLGEGYTADSSHNKKYIDIVRTLDDVNFRIKAALIQAIGNLRISRVGLRAVATLVESVLSPLVSQEVIDRFTVVIPLLTLLDKDPAELSAAEAKEIKDARSARQTDMTIEVVYAGAIHRLAVQLVFTG